MANIIYQINEDEHRELSKGINGLKMIVNNLFTVNKTVYLDKDEKQRDIEKGLHLIIDELYNIGYINNVKIYE